MTDQTIRVPADQLAQIKQGLIKLGYTDESLSDEVVQDFYYKYTIVRQTGFDPDTPYAINLIPDGALKDALLGKGVTADSEAQPL